LGDGNIAAVSAADAAGDREAEATTERADAVKRLE